MLRKKLTEEELRSALGALSEEERALIKKVVSGGSGDTDVIASLTELGERIRGLEEKVSGKKKTEDAPVGILNWLGLEG